MSIDALPPAPAATDPVDTFDAKAFAFNAALQLFRTQANATADTMQTNADILAAVLLGMALPDYAGTSSSSFAIGTGSKVFATQTGKLWTVGQIVVISNGANLMRGPVTAYSAGNLTVNVTSISGSGTFSSWTIGLSFDGLLLAKSGANADITSLTALTAGGLPDNSVLTADIANGAVTPAKLSQPPTLGTSVATTSGTAIDITGIPATANKVSVLFNGISTAGAASGTLLQLGTSGGVVNTGYTSVCVSSASTNTVASFTSAAGLAVQGGAVSENFIGVYELRRFSGNTWIGFISGNRSGFGWSGGGSIALGGALDRIRLTNVNGTDTFDAGSINIYYE